MIITLSKFLVIIRVQYIEEIDELGPVPFSCDAHARTFELPEPVASYRHAAILKLFVKY